LETYAKWESSNTNFSFHYPGHNYTGPGTTVINNILKGVKPTNINDYYAALHDLHCISATGCSDKVNVKYHNQLNNKGGLEAAIIKTTSKLSNSLGITQKLTENNSIPFTKDEIKEIVQNAKQILIKENPQFQQNLATNLVNSNLNSHMVLNKINLRPEQNVIAENYLNNLQSSITIKNTKFLDDF
jgi:hypothetical protein